MGKLAKRYNERKKTAALSSFFSRQAQTNDN